MSSALAPSAPTRRERAHAALSPWFLLLMGGVLSGAMLVLAGDDLILKCAALFTIWLFAAASCRFELTHPYVWYGLFYMLYGVSGPLLQALDMHPLGFWGGRDVSQLDFSYVLDLEYIGLLVLLIVIGPQLMNLRDGAADGMKAVIFGGLGPVLAVSLGVLGLLLFEIYSQGFQSKGEVTLYGSWITRFGFAYNLVVVSLTVLLFKLVSDGRIPMAYALIGVIVLLAAGSVFVSGQRNFLFRFAISAYVLIHITHRRIPWSAALVILAASLILIVWLGGQKMSLMGQTLDIGAVDLNAIDPASLPEKYASILLDPPVIQYLKLFALLAFGTELMTASNNLALIVDRVPHDLPYLNGATLFVADIARAILPGFIVGNSIPTSMMTYHNAFFGEQVEMGLGPGYTLLGAGYMNFGPPGVVMIAALFGVVLRFLYRWAGRSALGFLFYIGFIPIGAYATRMDISAPISQGLKHVLMPLIAMAVIGALRGCRSSTPDRRSAAERRAAAHVPSRHPNRDRRTTVDDRRRIGNRRAGKRTSAADRTAPAEES